MGGFETWGLGLFRIRLGVLSLDILVWICM